ncbi:MAG: glycosyl transferase, partial [Rikenellaceae bacterium]
MRTRYWIYLILILPVFIFRDYTPDNELRYISIAEEALQNNTWFTFYNHGLIYADKPPLYFWFIMLSKILFGSYQPWIIGLLSIVPAIGIIMVMDKWLAMEKIKHNLWASNLMLITSGIFLGGILVLRMDILMAFFITLSLYTFYKIYTKKDKPYDKWLLPIYIFLGIFTKGAMGFLTPIMSIVGFLIIKKEIRHFGHYFGLKQWGILIGLCLVWFSLVYVDGGSEYLNNILFKQTVGRGINSFHHKEPFYYYLPRIIFTFAPWSLLYLSTLIKGAWRHNFSTDIEKFFITIIVVNFVMLSLISSKLDIYLVPIYPFVAYLTSMLLMRNKPSALIITCIAIPAVVVALIVPASYMLKEMIPYKYQSLTIIRIGLFVVSAGGVAAIVYL